MIYSAVGILMEKEEILKDRQGRIAKIRNFVVLHTFIMGSKGMPKERREHLKQHEK